MHRKIGISIVALMLFSMLTPLGNALAHQEVADLILYNGTIVTMDEAERAEAVAIKGDKILAVGKNDHIKNYVGAQTEAIDLQRKMVIPGLNDSHLHLLSMAKQVHHVDLNEATSIAEVVEAIGERVQNTPKGEWILAASNWHEGRLEEGRLPTRWELDTVSPNHPVMIPRGGHVITVNSKALELAGITKDTLDPEGGVIVRDATGEPTGVIMEPPAMEMVKGLLPQTTPEDDLANLKDMVQTLNSMGVTAITEPGLKDQDISTYMELHKNNQLTARVQVLYRINELQDVEHAINTYPLEFGDDFLKMGGFKYLSDGGVEAGYLKTPYEIVPGEQEDPNFQGKLLLPAGGIEELEKMFALAAEKGWSVSTHAVGDGAIEAIIDLYAKINEKTPLKDLRWIIMHLFLPTEESMMKMKELNVLGTVQDHPVLLGHNQVRYHGHERAEGGIPIRSLLDNGIVLGGGTDAPVLPTSPFISLWWMTTRDTFTAGVLGKEEAITREEALYLYTLGSAITQFNEEKIGSITPGKLADMVVLSDDYFKVPDDQIKDLQAVLTIVGGKIVYNNESIDNSVYLTPAREVLEAVGAKVN